MEVQLAESLCRTLIARHLGPSWTFRWDRALRRFGLCRWDERIISMSRTLAEMNDEATVRDTVLHEIAHGLAPRKAGHGPMWRAIAEGIGARPDRVVDASRVAMPPPAFVGRCPSCGWEAQTHRRRRVACRRCCAEHNRGRFSTRFEMVWERASVRGVTSA